MLKVAEIKTAIEELAEDDFDQLRQWFLEQDWKMWDEQIERDSESGKLDFLIAESLEEKNKGQLKEL